MDQPSSENSRSGMLLPEKYVQPYQQHIITSGNLTQGLCLPFALLWNGHFSRKESKACSRKNEMGLFLSFYGLGFTLPTCSIPHVASATWWAPGLQRKRRVQPKGLLEQSKSSAREHDCRGGRHTSSPAPTDTHFSQKLFQAAWPHFGLLTVDNNLPLQGPMRKKIPFACPPFPLGPCAGTSLASACKPQCIQTSLVQLYI